MDIISSLVAVFGFWPVFIFGLIAFWLGKKSRSFALIGIGIGVLVAVVSMAIGLGFFGRDMELLIFVAYAVAGAVFSAITALSRSYYSGSLKKLFTPKSAI